MSKCGFIKVAFQLYWNHTSVWVFAFKFAGYFQNRNTSGGLLVGLAAADKIFVIKSFLNPFVPNALFLYSLKTSENLTAF